MFTTVALMAVYNCRTANFFRRTAGTGVPYGALHNSGKVGFPFGIVMERALARARARTRAHSRWSERRPLVPSAVEFVEAASVAPRTGSFEFVALHGNFRES